MIHDNEETHNLADTLNLRPSPYHAQKAAVAEKDGLDVCWSCFIPVVDPTQFIDIAMGGTFMRLCKSKDCLDRVRAEKLIEVYDNALEINVDKSHLEASSPVINEDDALVINVDNDSSGKEESS